MKCVRKTENSKIIRVSDNEAERLVYKKGYKYCPKCDYKAQQ